MATNAGDTFASFTTSHAETITTITSDNYNSNKRVPRTNRHSLLPFRHVSSSSEEDGSSHRHSRRFHQGLKLLDLTTKTRSGSNEHVKRDHVRSQASQGSGSGADAQSPSGSTTSFPAMTKEEFETLPPTIRRKVSLLECVIALFLDIFLLESKRRDMGFSIFFFFFSFSSRRCTLPAPSGESLKRDETKRSEEKKSNFLCIMSLGTSLVPTNRQRADTQTPISQVTCLWRRDASG